MGRLLHMLFITSLVASAYAYGTLVGSKWNYNITLSNRKEVDRVLDIVIKPFNIKLTLMFKFKYKSGGPTCRDWRSFEFGYRDEHGNYHLKRNVIPILVGYAPRQILAQIGMEGGVVIQGWALENYLKGRSPKIPFKYVVRLVLEKGFQPSDALEPIRGKVMRIGDSLEEKDAKIKPLKDPPLHIR